MIFLKLNAKNLNKQTIFSRKIFCYLMNNNNYNKNHN